MLPDRVSNPGLLTYEPGTLPIALRGPARYDWIYTLSKFNKFHFCYHACMKVQGIIVVILTSVLALALPCGVGIIL